MNLATFTAEADLVGRRIRIRWEFALAEGETLVDIPPVKLRRKERDFEFPPAGGGADPYLVFDSLSFPPSSNPPALLVTDLPGWTTREDGRETVLEAISVAMAVGSRAVESLRLTVATTLNPTGSPICRRFEILDSGSLPSGLEPGTTYYYQLTSSVISPDRPARATATPGESYGLNRKLYEALPAIYRRHDTITRPVTVGTDTVPEASASGGQLRRFLDLFGLPLDAMRSSAENLSRLHDLDRGDARFLPYLAAWIGWSLDQMQTIPLWRNEIKNAACLYRGVGSIPGLRALVHRYTGWNTHVAEFAQHLARSNLPPQMNIFAVIQSGGGWEGADEAARVLGFAPGNDEAIGNGGPAVLTSTVAEPFALRSGLELSIAAGNSLPETVRFDHDDFVHIARASALEIASVLNRWLVRARAEALAGGQIRLRTRVTGPDASLRVVPQAAALLTLESAPDGRLSALRDSQDRLRLFYATQELEIPPEGGPGRPRLRYKTFAYGEWRDSREALEADGNTRESVPPRSNPAVVNLDNDRIGLGWIANPGTAHARVHSAQGAVAAPQPAILMGQRRGPFAVPPGARLAFSGNWSGVDICNFLPSDFADPSQATPGEVAGALNSRLTQVTASVLPSGAIQLQTVQTGPRVRLRLELSQSSGIQALGFDDRNIEARGAWSDEIVWANDPRAGGLPRPEILSPPGRFADLFALRDPGGGVRLFWASHRAGLWRVEMRRGDQQAWVATNSGVSVLQPGGGWMTISSTPGGLPSNDVRAVLTDADGVGWFATVAGLSARQSNGVWRTFTTVDGLVSNDVRGLACDREGVVWAATPLGLSARRPDGSWVTFTTADGLPSNDIRQVVIDPDELPWVSTSGGIGARRADGSWRAITVADHLPSNDVRALTFAADGSLWAATAAGVAWRNKGDWATVTDGFPSSDVRHIAEGADGMLWFATGAGLAGRQADGRWVFYGMSHGLPSNDLRFVSVGADGTLWVATPAGVGLRGAQQEDWISLTAAQGLASNDTRAFQLSWSTTRELASGLGGNREPAAIWDSGGRLWLCWSRRSGIGSREDTWTLHQRLYDPATATWSAEIQMLPPPPSGRTTDREPALALLPSNQLALFFRSDRAGDTDLWMATPQPAAPATSLIPVSDGPASDAAPLPVISAGGTLWLFFRSDRNVPIGQISPRAAPSRSGRGSASLPETGTLRRNAGAATVLPGALQRNRHRQLWGDLLAYTAQRPAGEALLPTEFYSRGTIGFYLSNPRDDRPMTASGIARLRQLISHFLPVNVRAVMIVTPQLNQEFLYPPGADLEESYLDIFPILEILEGLADGSSAALPGWVFLRSNQAGQTVADPADLTSLRRRTFFPPPQ